MASFWEKYENIYLLSAESAQWVMKVKLINQSAWVYLDCGDPDQSQSIRDLAVHFQNHWILYSVSTDS